MTTGKKEADKKQAAADKRNWFMRLPRWARRTTYVGGLMTLAAIEAKTSFVQSRLFHSIAEGRTFTETETTSEKVAPPAVGPYDERLGYTQSLRFRKNLTDKGYVLESETAWQQRHVFGFQLYPIYNEKAQAGLTILDQNGKVMFDPRYPVTIYKDFESIPPVLAKSLLYVENRKELEDQFSTYNPAIEWTRFSRAVLGYGLNKLPGVSTDEGRFGGSTLATQLEKFRHSPGGITGSPIDKVRQMLTASVRSYKESTNTFAGRRRILTDYLNSMPLTSYPGVGEVSGFADGINLWFGRDFNEVNRLLHLPQEKLEGRELKEVAVAYRQAFALVLSVKKPSAYLLGDHKELEERIDNYMKPLVDAGILTPQLAEAVKAERLVFQKPKDRKKIVVAKDKTVDMLQVELMQDLQTRNIYETNRLDVLARATRDAEVSLAVTKMIHALNDPEVAAANGLLGFRMLTREQASKVIYSVFIAEKGENANYVRVQTDSFNGPLNMNEGTKLEPGSVHKLRLSVYYLETIANLHEKYALMDPEALKLISVAPKDHIMRDFISYMADPATDKSLDATINAAWERMYSANPHERFFTGGGLHTFNNFDNADNGRVLTLRESLQRSVNLPFVRLTRDLVYHIQAQEMHVDPEIYTDLDNDMRKEYLQKFADKEGQTFMWTFWKQQKDKSTDDVLSMLAGKSRSGPVAQDARLAVLYRSILPDNSLEDMTAFIKKHCKNCAKDPDFEKLYEKYAIDKFNLNDRAYLTHLHPLEIWLATYKLGKPEATWDDAVKASAETRIEAYKWLLDARNMQGPQNNRIYTMLEEEAITHMHAQWVEEGVFPFRKLVSSYALALGASGDTPAALAEFIGIIQNGGVRKETVNFTDIDLAGNTPYQLKFDRKTGESRRVIHEAVAKFIRKEMEGVIEKGTARRAYQSVKLSDGRVLSLGGKTGTGDNRRETYASNGAVKSSDVTSRVASFVFAIDEKYYGTIIAYVPGEQAADFKFTSALPVQVFKSLVPAIRPMLDRSYGVKPEAAANDTKPVAKPADTKAPSGGKPEAEKPKPAPGPMKPAA